MATDLPIPVTGADYLKRLARDVENLKRHTHVDPDTLNAGTDDVPPKPPTSLLATTDWQTNVGARVMFSWTAPTLDEANTELTDLEGYDVRWQYLASPGWHETFTPIPSLDLVGLSGNAAIEWQVRARDTNGNVSGWVYGDRITTPSGDPNLTTSGDVIVDSIRIVDYMSVQGENNEISPGATLTVTNGSLTPTAGPAVTPYWDKYDGGITFFLSNTRGFHHEADGTDPYYMGIFFYDSSANAPGGRWYGFPRVVIGDGGQRSSWEVFDMTVLWDGTKQVVVSTGLPWLSGGAGTPQVALRLFDFSTMDSSGSVPPVTLATIDWTPFLWGRAHHLGRCIGTGLAQQFIASYRDPDVDTVRVQRYEVTGSSITPVAGSTIDLSVTFDTDEGLTGVAYGSSAAMGYPGTDQTIIVVHKTFESVAFTTAGVAIPDFTFPIANDPGFVDACGSTADGANTFVGFRSAGFYQADNEARWVTKYSNRHEASGVSDTWWVSQTWFDPDVVGGTNETDQSPLSSVTVPDRAGVAVTIPPYPLRPNPQTVDDITAARLYIGRGATEPDRTEMELAAELNSPYRDQVLFDPTFPTGPATSPPPAVSTFPGSTPAKVQSAGGEWSLSGDGAAAFEDVSINGTATVEDVTVNGTLSGPGLARMAYGTVDITPVADTPTYVTITLPAGLFTAAPVCIATAESSQPGARVSEVTVLNPTTSDFRIYIYRNNTTTTRVHWLAVGL